MGIVNNILLAFVEKEKGPDKKNDLMKKIGITDKYQDERIYPEVEFQKLYREAAACFSEAPEVVEDKFGKFAGQVISNTFPGYFEDAGSAKEALRRVPGHHIELPTLAGTPTAKLTILKETENELTYMYNSPNKLCVFLKSLVQFTLDAYQEEGTIEEPLCIKKGDDYCKVIIKFNK